MEPIFSIYSNNCNVNVIHCIVINERVNIDFPNTLYKTETSVKVSVENLSLITLHISQYLTENVKYKKLRATQCRAIVKTRSNDD